MAIAEESVGIAGLALREVISRLPRIRQVPALSAGGPLAWLAYQAAEQKTREAYFSSNR